MLPAGSHEPGSDIPSRPNGPPARSESEPLALGEHFFEAGEWGAALPTDAPSLLPDGAAIVRLLKRRRVLTLVLGAMVAAAASLATLHLVPLKYTARVRFHILTRPPAVVFQPVDGGSDFVNYQRTQAELIKSQLVCNVALEKPEVAALAIVREQGDPVEWLKDQLQIDFPAPEILRISLIGMNPEETGTLLSAVKDAYLQKVANRENNERQSILEQLTNLSKTWEKELAKKRGDFRKRAQETVSSDAPTLAFGLRLALAQLYRAREDLLQIHSERLRAELQLKVRQQLGNQNEPSPAVAPELNLDGKIEQDKRMVDLLGQKEEVLKNRNKALRLGVLAEDHPTIKGYNLELESVEAALSTRKRELQTSTVKQQLQQGNHLVLPSSVPQLKEQVAFLKEMEDALNAEIKQLREETKDIKDSSLDLDGLRTEIDHLDNMAKTVATRAEALRVEQDAPARIRLLEQPTVSSATNARKRLLAAIGAGLAGWALAAFGILCWELRARRIMDPAEVSRGLKIRLIGTLPVLARPGYRRLPQADSLDKYPRDLLTESVDRACMKLMHAARQQPLRVVLITSALSGEGKTSLASHLAVSLARAGKRTLLIDADLRRPMLHRLFDLAVEPGLSAVIRGDLAVSEVIRPTLIRGLEVIPAGRADLPAILALGSERVGAMLRNLQEAYDFVLVDSAPVLAVVDAPLLAQHVDGVLFSVLCSVSHLPSVYQSYQELASLGVRIIGAVVGGVRNSGFGNEYYALDPMAEKSFA